MSYIGWSPRALYDLARLEAFLYEKDPDAAFRVRQAIRASVEILGDRPRLGRSIEGFVPTIREWPIRFGSSGYVARYQYHGERVTILAVRHMREDGFSDG